MSAGLGLLAKTGRQRCGVRVAVAVLLTGAVPLVPEAVTVLVMEAVVLSVEACPNVWLWPGASGPQVPTVKSSLRLVGVPLSSTRVPEAVKKSPLLMTEYP